MGFTQGIFLADTRNAEWLTRKASQQNIMLRDTRRFNLSNVTGNGMTVREVFPVGLLRVAIPFTCVDTLSSMRLKSQAHASNSGKQVYEGEVTPRMTGAMLQYYFS